MVGMTRKWKAHEDMSAWSEKRERWQEKESFIPFYFRVREFFNLYPRTRLSRSPEQDNMNKSSESLEQDLNGTARLLVRLSYDLAFEQDLRDALATEREKERELDVSGIPIPLWLPVDCAVKFPPISAKRKRVRMKTSIKKHVSKVMTALLMPSLLISISRRHFSMQKFKYSGS